MSTTTTSNGSVNAMHNSPNPLTVLGPLAEHLLFVGH
ncbi:MAG: potassium-transporting ATPase subunit KdpA [Phycisphaeraceae bacterium]|nr:potassium-transporting ATPase subunit KdpA [Phycisphaeraceae bacterium]